LEREKKARADLDKVKRKVEGDLKAAQGSLEELDRLKKDADEGIKKRDQDLKVLQAKVEDEQNQGANLSKKLKEFMVIA
jgi:hypothetical protein